MFRERIYTMQAVVATAAILAADNPLLQIGQVGFESDTGLFKVGDGQTAWASLSYAASHPDHTHDALYSALDHTHDSLYAALVHSHVNDGAAPVNAVASTATLTSDETAPGDGDTVTLGTKTYTFKTVLSTEPAVEGEVLIGASAAAALDNLKAAVNHTGTPGTDYTCEAAHPDIEATTNTDTTQVFVARVAGEAGDALASEEDSDHLAFGETTFGSGVDGTVGSKGEIRFDETYLYILSTDNTISGANWKKIALA